MKKIIILFTIILTASCYKTDIKTMTMIGNNQGQLPSINFHIGHAQSASTEYYGVNGTHLAGISADPQYLIPFNTCINRIEAQVAGTTTGATNLELIQNGSSVASSSILSTGWNSFVPNIYVNPGDQIGIAIYDITAVNGLEIDMFIYLGCDY